MYQICVESHSLCSRYLYNELKVSVDRVYFFNTHFFPTLTKKIKGQDGINYDGVKSWTKRDDVFSYDYIVVPINEK
jgi:sentrin-specific protease 7